MHAKAFIPTLENVLFFFGCVFRKITLNTYTAIFPFLFSLMVWVETYSYASGATSHIRWVWINCNLIFKIQLPSQAKKCASNTQLHTYTQGYQLTRDTERFIIPEHSVSWCWERSFCCSSYVLSHSRAVQELGITCLQASSDGRPPQWNLSC